MYKFIFLFVFSLIVSPEVYGAPNPADLEKYRVFPLHKIAKAGDVDMTLNALQTKAGTEINSKDDGGDTPLHIAVEHGGEQLVTTLLLAGADMYTKNKNGESPFHVTARIGKHELILPFINAGFDFNFRDDRGYTVAHTAIQYMHTNFATQIINEEPDILYARNLLGNNLLLTAAKYGCEDIVPFLLKRGNEDYVHTTNNLGDNALLTVARYEHMLSSMTAHLLNHGADIYTENDEGDSFFLQFAAHSMAEINRLEQENLYISQQSDVYRNTLHDIDNFAKANWTRSSNSWSKFFSLKALKTQFKLMGLMKLYAKEKGYIPRD